MSWLRSQGRHDSVQPRLLGAGVPAAHGAAAGRLAGPHEQDVAGLDRDAGPLRRRVEVLGQDWLTGLHGLDTEQPGDVDEHAAGDDAGRRGPHIGTGGPVAVVDEARRRAVVHPAVPEHVAGGVDVGDRHAVVDQPEELGGHRSVVVVRRTGALGRLVVWLALEPGADHVTLRVRALGPDVVGARDGDAVRDERRAAAAGLVGHQVERAPLVVVAPSSPRFSPVRVPRKPVSPARTLLRPAQGGQRRQPPGRRRRGRAGRCRGRGQGRGPAGAGRRGRLQHRLQVLGRHGPAEQCPCAEPAAGGLGQPAGRSAWLTPSAMTCRPKPLARARTTTSTIARAGALAARLVDDQTGSILRMSIGNWRSCPSDE